MLWCIAPLPPKRLYRYPEGKILKGHRGLRYATAAEAVAAHMFDPTTGVKGSPHGRIENMIEYYFYMFYKKMEM